MYETVLDHGYGWTKAMTTYLTCRINSEGNPLIIQNSPLSQENKHAEKKLIDTINAMDKSVIKKITIYINNSPCSSSDHNCSGELIQFLNENPHIRLLLYVTNLYKIRRMSCIGELHNPLFYRKDYEDNFIGLKNLMEHGRCEVMAFNYDIWSELLNIVPVSSYCKDNILSGYNIKWNTHDRSREEEDNRIASDLMYIRYPPYVYQPPIYYSMH